jgi:ubiquinone/menaquinone biosynthesis C-methylase UbiE
MVSVVADVYASIADADPALVERIAEVLELRAGDPQQQAMRQAYLGDVGFPDGARVLEVGCGTGPVTRTLAAWPGVAEVTGVDPSSTFLAAARSPPASTTPGWCGWRESAAEPAMARQGQAGEGNAGSNPQPPDP